MAKPVKEYTHLQMEAALCAWEAMIEFRINTADPKFDPAKYPEWRVEFEQVFEYFGSVDMRHCSIAAGCIVLAVHDLMTAKGIEFHDAYDWEFVPGVLKRLDWRSLVEQHQYNGKPYKPNASKILSEMIEEMLGSFVLDPAREIWLQKAHYAASKLWGYADLLTDHKERTDAAYTSGEDPETFVKFLGEKYELTPASTWRH